MSHPPRHSGGLSNSFNGQFVSRGACRSTLLKKLTVLRKKLIGVKGFALYNYLLYFTWVWSRVLNFGASFLHISKI